MTNQARKLEHASARAELDKLEAELASVTAGNWEVRRAVDALKASAASVATADGTAQQDA